MERKVRTLSAARPNGETLVVHEFQSFIDATTYDSPVRQWLPGLKRLETQNGRAVNFIDESTFELVATGERLKVLG